MSERGHLNPASTRFNESEITAEQERGSIGPVRQRQRGKERSRRGERERERERENERRCVCVCVLRREKSRV